MRDYLVELAAEETTCDELALANLECQLPTCPPVNVTDLSGIDFETSKAELGQDGFDTRVNSTAKFICANLCRQTLDFKTNYDILYPFSYIDETFRLADFSSADEIKYTCIYNKTTQESSWLWEYSDDLLIDLPICHMYCPDNPIEVEPPLTRTWDDFHWVESHPTYQCSDGITAITDHKLTIFKLNMLSVMAFALPNAERGDPLVMNCSADEESGKLGWVYTWPGLDGVQSHIPECNYLCLDDPPDDPSQYNRTWQDGIRLVGTGATYTCLGK